MTSYNVDWNELVTIMLHPERRTPRRISFLKALVKRIRDVHSEFVESHASNKDKLKWNGQTILLQRLLQIKYGSGITIENLNQSLNVQIEFESDNLGNPITEQSPEFSNPTNAQAGDGVLGVGFKVNVPGGILFSESEMRAVINEYIIGYKTYQINSI